MKEAAVVQLNVAEALRYLGYGENPPDERTGELLVRGQKALLEAARPRYIYRVFDIRETSEGICAGDTPLCMPGDSIREHLQGCEKAALMAATLSEGADRLIRVASLQDMAYAVILDSLGSAMVEQVCDEAEKQLREEFGEWNQTWRFGVGYGDLPLTLQGLFLQVLEAPKRIGLNETGTHMLTPSKSVTCVIGLSKNPISRQKIGCQSCNLRGDCIYRKKGGRCNV